MSSVMRKSEFWICENKDADQLHSYQRFCFRYMDRAIPRLPKFQASHHLLWLYSMVCVGPSQKLQRLAHDVS